MQKCQDDFDLKIHDLAWVDFFFSDKTPLNKTESLSRCKRDNYLFNLMVLYFAEQTSLLAPKTNKTTNQLNGRIMHKSIYQIYQQLILGTITGICFAHRTTLVETLNLQIEVTLFHKITG